LSFQIGSRRPFGNKSEIAATSVIPVAAKKKILKAIMPKGREVAEDLREFMTVDFLTKIIHSGGNPHSNPAISRRTALEWLHVGKGL
jgi:hypothetical protein